MRKPPSMKTVFESKSNIENQNLTKSLSSLVLRFSLVFCVLDAFELFRPHIYIFL